MTSNCNLRQGFRAILRGLASTVTIISTEDEGRSFGIVVTATTSVSFDPPSHLVCINRASSIHAPVRRRGSFCVNILARENEAIGKSFARLSGEERFENSGWSRCSSPNPLIGGLPYLTDAQATLFCSIQKEVDFGTHTLFISNIEDLEANQKTSPLLYCDGTFGEFRRVASPHRVS
jgi:flavin reductase